jgi:CSLREA domain-containing protein
VRWGIATLAVLATAVAAPAASADVFDVNSLADTTDGVCDPVNCTFREAIEAANALVGVSDTIVFSGLTSSAPHRIDVGAALPAISDPVFIDGTSAPGYDARAPQPVVEVVGPGGSAADGLLIQAAGNTIQGLAIGGFNAGIMLIGGGGNNIGLNHLGTNAAGTVAIPNQTGIVLNDPSNVIGPSGAPNLISGNESVGLVVASDQNLITGNRIGTNAAGTGALPNGIGVSIGGASNQVGSGAVAERNVISGNAGVGVRISGSGNTVDSNLIGTDITGAAALGNGSYGVEFAAGGANNVLGGIFAVGNVIAFNGVGGVRVPTGAAGQILQNSIDSNGGAGPGLGIDVGPIGLTPNDSNDRDAVPNFPVISSAVVSDAGTRLRGTIDGRTLLGTYRIEFFSSPSCDPSEHGEGRTFLDRLDVASGESGDATFDHLANTAVPVGHAVTATAAGEDAFNTSEFSRCVIATREGAPVALPPPVQGEQVNVAPVSGVVRVRVPGGRFVTLRAGQQIPVGSFVDTTRGVVRLTSAANRRGASQRATFRDGLFRTRQRKATGAFTELKLAGALKGCRPRQAGASARRGRRLWGSGKGRFRSVGNRASAGIRGTRWLIEDRCDGSTLVRVKQGRVTVRDFVRRRTIQLKAGQSYVATPRRRG